MALLPISPHLGQVLTFSCPVRSSYTQSLEVSNPTDQRWTMQPRVEGEHWSAAPVLLLEPLETKHYPITYAPWTMAAQGKKHVVRAGRPS